jgi:hypothetical protein
MMDAELKAKWVEALRSGNYVQGTLALRQAPFANGKAYSYCCLGVLCEVALGPFIDGYSDIEQIIPSATHRGRLMQMNDGERKSFSEIADYIETNL